ncbi:hypothetical protein DFH09DRAFT_1086917 [Mycena vulgaris]|nr:hypothetical protein DFH09DRAFT_1086917 [Mycena vulgaris]
MIINAGRWAENRAELGVPLCGSSAPLAQNSGGARRSTSCGADHAQNGECVRGRVYEKDGEGKATGNGTGNEKRKNCMREGGRSGEMTQDRQKNEWDGSERAEGKRRIAGDCTGLVKLPVAVEPLSAASIPVTAGRLRACCALGVREQDGSGVSASESSLFIVLGLRPGGRGASGHVFIILSCVGGGRRGRRRAVERHSQVRARWRNWRRTRREGNAGECVRMHADVWKTAWRRVEDRGRRCAARKVGARRGREAALGLIPRTIPAVFSNEGGRIYAERRGAQGMGECGEIASTYCINVGEGVEARTGERENVREEINWITTDGATAGNIQDRTTRTRQAPTNAHGRGRRKPGNETNRHERRVRRTSCRHIARIDSARRTDVHYDGGRRHDSSPEYFPDSYLLPCGHLRAPSYLGTRRASRVSETASGVSDPFSSWCSAAAAGKPRSMAWSGTSVSSSEGEEERDGGR